MLNKFEREYLINLAMQAEIECYNSYFMKAAEKILSIYINKHGAKVIWEFFINAGTVANRLYLEFCLSGFNTSNDTISFKID